jgi:hypothetical protein
MGARHGIGTYGPDCLQVAVPQAGESWQAGITSVSELSDQEKRLRLGANPPAGKATLEERERSAAAKRGAAMLAVVGAPAAGSRRHCAALGSRTARFGVTIQVA